VPAEPAALLKRAGLLPRNVFALDVAMPCKDSSSPS
jgi:hypothetical protein